MNFRKIETNGLVIISVAAALLYWYFDSLYPGEFISRVFTSFLFISYGFFTQYLINSYVEQRNIEAKYHDLLDHINDGIYRLNKDGYFTFANKVIMDSAGIPLENLYDYHYLDIVAPEDHETARKNFGKVMKGEEAATHELKYKTADGDLRVMEINTTPIHGQGGIVGLQSISRDITKRKRAEVALQQEHAELEQRVVERTEELRWINEELQKDMTERKRAEEALRMLAVRNEAILAAVPDIIMEVDGCKRYTWANQAGVRFFGEDVVGREASYYFEEEQETYNKVQPLFDGVEGVIYIESWQRRKDGEKRLLSWWCKVLKDKQGFMIGALSTGRDITERKQVEEALKDSERRYRELSIVDDLTQLYNSRHFYFQLKIELDRSNRYEQPFTLLLLDLDNFKAFNDAYGHVKGDHVLRRLGHVMKRCLRETDLAYRYGGEEFTVVLPMTTSADGAITAERIRTEFKQETFSPVPGQEVHVTVSIGLAQYKPHEEMKAFVHRVDQLMYQGKKNGKDRVCAESSSQEQFKW